MTMGDPFALRVKYPKLLERTVVTSPLGSRLADDDVVEDFDPQKLSGPDEVAGGAEIRRGRTGVSRYAANGITFVMPHSVLCRMACDLPGFDGTNRTPMRHKTVTLSQPFEVGEQLIIGPVSPRLAAQGAHFGEDGLF